MSTNEEVLISNVSLLTDTRILKYSLTETSVCFKTNSSHLGTINAFETLTRYLNLKLTWYFWMYMCLFFFMQIILCSLRDETNPITYNLRLQILGAHRPKPLVYVDIPLGYHLQTRGCLPIIQMIQNRGRCLYRRTALLKNNHAVSRRFAHNKKK